LLNLNDYLNRHFITEVCADVRKHQLTTMLDLGCGTRPYRDLYEGAFKRVVAADVEARGNFIDVIASADSLPFAAGSFDAVLLSEVIEHVPHDIATLREINRVLTDNGYLVLTVPFMHMMHEMPKDYRRYTEFGIEHLLRSAGFEIERFRRRGGLFSLLLILGTSLVQGFLASLSRIPVAGIAFKPIRWLVDEVLEMLHRAVAAALSRRSRLRPPSPGTGLSGYRGYLSLWTLGFCVLARKVAAV
jgi:SAM-dependent methyltransferase